MGYGTNWSNPASGGGGATNFSQLLGTCAQSQIAVFDPTTSGNWITYYFTDFLEYQTGTTTGNFPYWSTTNGTGVNQRSSPTSSDTNRNGMIQLSGGSATSAYALCMISVQTIFLGSCAYSFSTALQMQAAPVTSGNNFSTRVGFVDNWPSTNNAAYMTVDYSIANDQNWKLVTKKGGTTTTTDTGVAADTNWHNIRVEINNAGTAVQGYIDGALVASNTANIPNNTVIGPVIQNAWVSGTTAVLVKYDWMYLKYNLGSSRGTF